MLVSMKTKNNNEVVTRGILRETLDETLDKRFEEFAVRIENNIITKVTTNIEAKIDEKIDKSIGDLAIMVQKGFMAVTGDIHALTERVDAHDKEFKKINDKLDNTLSELKQVRI